MGMPEEKKLKPLAKFVLINEIGFQVKIAENAAERLNNFSDSIESWGAIQSILVAGANVSKILWPIRKRNKKRGKEIRAALDVNDDNILSERKFRDHFEHYDERIEDWFKENDTSSYVDNKIAPSYPTLLYFSSNAHRSYDPITKKLTFRGESIDLAAVLAELAKIREKCPFADLWRKSK